MKYKLNGTGFNTYNTGRSREGKDNERRGKKKKKEKEKRENEWTNVFTDEYNDNS